MFSITKLCVSTTLRRVAVLLAPAVAAGVMTGCFGGGGDDGSPIVSTPAASVPDSALASATAYTQFTLATTLSSSETAEPLTADNVTTPPSTDTDEPVPVS